MMRDRRRPLHILTLLADLLAIVIAFEGAVRLRVALNPLFHAQLDAALLDHLVPPLALVLFLWSVASAWLGLYRRRRGSRLVSVVIQLAETMTLVLVLTIVVTFFVRDLGEDFSRSFVVFLAALGVVVMLVLRALLWIVVTAISRGEIGRERVLLVGRGKGIMSLIARLEKNAGRAVVICGVVTPGSTQVSMGLGNPVPLLGVVSDLATMINRHRADRVIAVEREVPLDDLYACIAICTRMGIPLNYTAGILQTSFAQVGVTDLGDVSLIEVRGLEFTRAQEVLKRVFDLLVAAFLAVILSPVMITLAILVRLTSPGPILYVAPRVGRGGRHFLFLKFRSMTADADARREGLTSRNEKDGHLFKIRSDPRVTPLGRFMRRYSLDELPQLFNVLRGGMSLVGPRPLPAVDLESDGLSREHRFWSKQRSRVPPGITGLWQVRGRSTLGFEHMLRLDIAYVRNWNIWLDIRILLQTLPAVLRRRGAY